MMPDRNLDGNKKIRIRAFAGNAAQTPALSASRLNPRIVFTPIKAAV